MTASVTIKITETEDRYNFKIFISGENPTKAEATFAEGIGNSINRSLETLQGVVEKNKRPGLFDKIKSVLGI